MAILQQPGTGYRDPSKAMSIKALQSRLKAAQEAAAQATQVQNPITSPMAGVAHLAGVAAAGLGQSQAERAEADARGQLAQIMSGVGPEGPTPQQTALINQLDPDLGGKIFENAMEARRQEDQQQHALTMQGGQQTFTAGQNDAARQAEADRQAALFGHQDTTLDKTQTFQTGERVAGETAKETSAIAANTREDQDVIDAAAIAETKAKADAARETEQAAANASLEPKVAQLNEALKRGTIDQPTYDAEMANLETERAAARNLAEKNARSAGTNAIDTDFAKQVTDWESGGSAGVAKNLAEVGKSINLLNQPGVIDISGKLAGLVPEGAQAWVNPEGKIARDSIRTAVQNSLTDVLGSQFAAVEGAAMLERAFDPSIGDAENVRRAQLLMDQITQSAKAKQAMIDYWNANGGTLDGYVGPRPDINAMRTAAEGGGAGGAPAAAPAEEDDDAFVKQLLQGGP